MQSDFVQHAREIHHPSRHLFGAFGISRHARVIDAPSPFAQLAGLIRRYKVLKIASSNFRFSLMQCTRTVFNTLPVARLVSLLLKGNKTPSTFRKSEKRDSIVVGVGSTSTWSARTSRR